MICPGAVSPSTGGAVRLEESSSCRNPPRPHRCRTPLRRPTPRPHPPPTRLPGITLCTVAALAAYGAGLLLPGVSPLILAIVGGIVVANLVPLPAATAPGIAFAAKPVLRAGIVLLGLQVVLGDILGLGLGVIAVVVGIVAVGIIGTIAIGRGAGPLTGAHRTRGLRLLDLWSRCCRRCRRRRGSEGRSTTRTSSPPSLWSSSSEPS